MKGSRGDPNAPYWVHMRNLERGFLRDMLQLSGSVEAACVKLGVTAGFFHHRARRLGGVFDGDLPKEPFTWTVNKTRQKKDL